MGLFLLFFLLVPQTVSGEPLLALDPDAGDTLTPAEIAQVQEVISINQPLLGAAQREYCPKGRSPCLASLRAPATSEIIEPLRIESIWPETKAGSEWPTRVRPSNPRRLQVRIHWRKGNGRATRSIPLLIFGLSDGPRKENCVFPLEHWEWSGMGRSERFAIPPRGICGEKQLNVTDLLLRLVPDRPIWAIRFLSPEEGAKWTGGATEDLHREGTWTTDHPYAKFFFLNSMRWWRGGGSTPSPRYAGAIRLTNLPLVDLQALSQSRDAFLNFYEEGAQIELTIVTREGLARVLRWPMEFLVDRAADDAKGPDLQPAPPLSEVAAPPIKNPE